MALFQKSVINKYLSNQDKEELLTAYQKFKKFCGDSERLENIKQLKEENYQEGFLREIFVEVLGYTINPDKNYNLTTEFKNETDSKKADGAILKEQKAIGVIELKSTKTVNLESITKQAFNYKNNQSKCKYVITSNFEKLFFYIDNATEWEEFNLFSLTEKDFALLYLLLNQKNLLNDIPLQIKKESRLHEESISDKLYKDYSQFKHKIYNNLVKNNPQYDKLVLFKKSQKLLDRVLFILFAEDSGLVPPNAISKIVDQYEQLKELDEAQSLYSRFLKFFHHLNIGHKYKTYSLPAYNGGLFKEDEILDNVHIDDEILLDDMLHLSSYDFSTEVDVNILGHIFEHSLTEIEELTAELKGTLVEREKSKRKKDGIFYTPKYITKYIVDNTIGTLCNEKKKELNLNNIDEQTLENSKTKSGTLTAKAEKIFSNLDEYREYILTLKILDPACGSGAFLNQALDFLINEHKWIDEYKASLLQEGFAISEYEKEIVENNIYGVDINEEAVEIAKLSLWLRTAKKGRKLSTLSNNIKCGNSLIDDPKIAGEKAFDWNEEFKEIMSNGGFDVVIGNPPYVQLQKMKEGSKKLQKIGYRTFERTGDLYALFYEKGLDLLKVNGLLTFITGSAWLRTNYGKSLRRFFLEKTELLQVIDFSDCSIFKDATVLTTIVQFRKNSVEQQKVASLRLTKKDQEKVEIIDSYFNENKVYIESFAESSWVISNKSEYPIKLKIENQGSLLKNWEVEIYRGILTGYNEAFVINEKTKNKLISEHPKCDELLKPLLRGRDIERYKTNDSKLWIISTFPARNIDIELYPSIKTYLERFGKKIYQIGESYIDENGKKQKTRKKTQNEWFETQDTIAYYEMFDRDKIIYPNMTKFLPFVLDTDGYYTNQKCFILSGELLEYLVCFFNSKLFRFCFEEYFPELQGNSREMNKVIFQELPIKKVTIEINDKFKLLSDKIHNQTKSLNNILKNFAVLIKSKYSINSLPSKLENWYKLEFKSFLNELKKIGIKLKISEEAEWLTYFNEQKEKIEKFHKQITKTDNEIDVMVYKLYNLTYQEVKIVDPNFWMSEGEYENFEIN